jgi:6-phosphogluconate dehydrogenase
VQIALDLGVPVSGIAEAVFARAVSGHAELRQAARGLPGPAAADSAQLLVEDVEQAQFASKIVAYAQGFHQIQAGSAEYGWSIDPGAMARIWRGGCIIRAKFLEHIRRAYDGSPQLPSLLADDYFRDAVSQAQDAWRRVIVTATQLGIPVPGFATALAYYDSLRAERLPAALVQGQRDFFGAHTYRRIDREGSFHVTWGGDRAEVAG